MNEDEGAAESVGERRDFSPERIRFLKDLLLLSLGEPLSTSVRLGFDLTFGRGLDGVDGRGTGCKGEPEGLAEVATLHLEAAAPPPAYTFRSPSGVP